MIKRRLITLVTTIFVGLTSLNFPIKSVIAADKNTEYAITDEIHGVNDSVFYITRPDEASLTVINASQFGLSVNANDNTQAMREAFYYCRQHPNTKLVIDKGVYHFSPDEDIYLNTLKNTLIDANNSEFIFSTPHYFKVYACDNVEIRNMVVDWNWDTLRLGSLVKIENENDTDNTLEIEFTELDEVDANIPLLSFMQYDPVDLVAGVHGSFKIYSPFVDTNCIKSVEKIKSKPNVLKITHSGALDYFRNDEVYLLRHYIYGGQVFNTVEESSNITYNNISIYGACGMGYVFAYGANHYQIINSYIGLRPGAEDKYRISTTADGIHISNSAGYFRVDNCDLSFCGDDIINIHANMFYIKSIDYSRKVIQGTVPNKIVETGHKLKFMDLDFNNIDYEATVESITRNGYEATITLKEPLPGSITTDMVAYNKVRDSANYVLTNNYVHETKGRGFLLNSDNGLCDGNTFYRTCGQTLQVRTDIPKDRVIEGTGADHIQISNNEFIECNFGGRGDVITIESLLNGKRVTNTPLSDIKITNNQFTSCYQEIIDADNVNGLKVESNIIRACENYTIGEHCRNVTTESNILLPEGAFPVITPSSEQYTISGHIKSDIGSKDPYQNFGFTVKFDELDLEATTDEDGSFIIRNVPANTEGTLLISKAGHLLRKISNITVKSNIGIGTEKDPVKMFLGDITKDNTINMHDVIIIGSIFNLTSNDSRYNKVADLNIDGSINMSDVMIVAKHFGMTSNDYIAPLIYEVTQTPLPTSTPTQSITPSPSPSSIN